MSLFWRGKPVNHEPWDSRLHSSSNLQCFFFAVVCFPGKTRREAFENQVWSVRLLRLNYWATPQKKHTRNVWTLAHVHETIVGLWGSTSSKHVHTVHTRISTSPSSTRSQPLSVEKPLFSGFLSTLMNRTAVVYSLTHRIHVIYTYIWLIFMVNVGKYTIHGSYGLQ